MGKNFREGERIRIVKVYEGSSIGWPEGCVGEYVGRIEERGHGLYHDVIIDEDREGLGPDQRPYIWHVHEIEREREFYEGERVRVVHPDDPFWRDDAPASHLIDGLTGTLVKVDYTSKYPYVIELDDDGRTVYAWFVAHIDSEENKVTININPNEVEALRKELAEVKTQLALSEDDAAHHERLADQRAETVQSLTIENNSVRAKLDKFGDDVVEALKDLASAGHITDEKAYKVAEDLGLEYKYRKPFSITVRLTIPSDEAMNYASRKGLTAEDITEADIENILNENDTDIEFWVDSFETEE